MNSSDGSSGRTVPGPQGRAVALRSVGCRTNQQELVALAADLAAAGCRLVRDCRHADTIIVNTCCVTAAAEGKSRRLVAQVARAAPGARVLVTGCCAQADPSALAGMRSVQWVIANSHKQRIAALLDSPPGVYHGAPLEHPRPGALLSADMGRALGRTRLPVKIQEGCSNRCAYCIVPRVRGPSRSVSADSVVELCRRAAGAGTREIVLTGTHIGQFHDGASGLEALCGRLAALGGDFRVRLSSLDPRDLTDGILALLGSSPRFCPHIHVSVQSFAPDVLHGMGREATDTERLVERLAAFRARYPHAALGADLIVGFPGESDGMFARTVDGVRAAGFTHGHVFRFSARPGTPAALMRPRVESAVARDRHARLCAHLAALNESFLAGCIGQPHRLVIEQAEPVRGLSGNYIRVRVDGGQARPGEWLDVMLTGRLRSAREQCTAEPLGPEVAADSGGRPPTCADGRRTGGGVAAHGSA